MASNKKFNENIILNIHPQIFAPRQGDIEHRVHDYSADIFICEEYEEVFIGSISGFFIDVTNTEYSFFDIFDLRSETCPIYENLFGFDGCGIKGEVLDVTCVPDGYINENILYLSRLEIKAEYRKQGYGLSAIRAFIHYFGSGAGLIVMKPFPLQFEGGIDEATKKTQGLAKFNASLENSTKKLERYYGKLGFIKIKDTPYMARASYWAMPDKEVSY